MERIRAIYIGDVQFNLCNVFELNLDTDKFVMINHPDVQYNKDTIIADEGFLIFKVTKNYNKAKRGYIKNVYQIKDRKILN